MIIGNSNTPFLFYFRWHGTLSKLSLVSSMFITDRSVKVALAGVAFLF